MSTTDNFSPSLRCIISSQFQPLWSLTVLASLEIPVVLVLTILKTFSFQYICYGFTTLRKNKVTLLDKAGWNLLIIATIHHISIRGSRVRIEANQAKKPLTLTNLSYQQHYESAPIYTKNTCEQHSFPFPVFISLSSSLNVVKQRN